MFNLIDKIEKKYEFIKPRIERKVKVNNHNLILFKNYFYNIGFVKQFPDQVIESVYFDDSNLSFARSNINGEFYRIKPRIRWYDNDLSKINYEFKIKKGFNGFKVVSNDIYSQSLNKNELIDITKKFFNNFLKINLHETVSIKYKRSYLIHPSGVRLTLDKDLHYRSPKINLNKSMKFEVIEFKYPIYKDNFFREVLFKSFAKLPIRLTKCSKYVEAVTSEYSN